MNNSIRMKWIIVFVVALIVISATVPVIARSEPEERPPNHNPRDRKVRRSPRCPRADRWKGRRTDLRMRRS